MKENTLWDYPKVPDELKKWKPIEEQINADISKRSWKLRIVRHRVKEILANLIK